MKKLFAVAICFIILLAFLPKAFADVDDSYSKSLLHFNGTDTSTTFTDESGKTWTAHGDAQLDTAQSKFGGGSGLFDGTGDYLDTPDSTDFDIGSDNFTAELWIRKNENNRLQSLFGQSDSAGWNSSSWGTIQLLANNTVRGLLISGDNFYIAASNGTISDTNWHHLALVRSGNTLTLYIDGTADGTANVTGVTANNSSNKFSIGRNGEYNGNHFNGWIDEFRLSKGIARWTSNFTPPSQEYAAPTPTPTDTPTPTPTPTYTISGTVYNDNNGNGVQDAGETGYESATVTLSGAGSATATTSASGAYSFTNLASGSYSVTLTVPEDYEATTDNPVSVALSANTSANFGIQPPIFSDDFNDANNTDLSDHNASWHLFAGGEPVIQNDSSAHWVTNSDSGVYLAGHYMTDQCASVKLHYPILNNGSYYDLFARVATSAATYYDAHLDSSGGIGIGSQANFTLTSQTFTQPSSGTHTFKFCALGSALVAYFDNEQIVTYFDSGNSQGYPGFGGMSGTNMYKFVLTDGSEMGTPPSEPTGYPAGNHYRPLTITPDSSEASGYPVSLQFDHAALVTAGKSQSSGNDVAIFYDATGSFSGSQVEIDRHLDTLSNWNNSSTKVWFELQASLYSADSTHYRVYYGASSYTAKSASVFTTSATSGSEQSN